MTEVSLCPFQTPCWIDRLTFASQIYSFTHGIARRTILCTGIPQSSGQQAQTPQGFERWYTFAERESSKPAIPPVLI